MGFQTVRQTDHITLQLHLVLGGRVFQHVGYDEWQVVLCDDGFSVAQLSNALCNLLCLLRCELKSQLLQVLLDICLAGVLSEGIFAFASEAFGNEGIAIEVVLIVAISMYASPLGKDII